MIDLKTVRASQFAESCSWHDRCPLAPVHARMRDARRLWIQAFEHYHDPESFRTFLNSCIQALRNVTFVLQKNKDRVPAFDEWYEKWRIHLKADPILRWLTSARNRVVKQGDLATKSYARASIVASYLQTPSFEREVNPLISIRDLGQALRSQGIPKDRLQDGYIVVERRWIADDLEDHELLDALAHSYGVLARMILGAHVQIHAETVSREVAGTPDDLLESEGRPPCMISVEEYRSIHIRLSSGEIVDIERQPYKLSPKDYEEARKRYGDPIVVDTSEDEDDSSLRHFARMVLERAKQFLVVGKTLVPVVFLLSRDNRVHTFALEFEDRTEKFAIWSAVAKDVERLAAKAVVTVNESWVAPFDSRYPSRPASESPERQEVISVDAISESGEKINMIQFFERLGEEISFGDFSESSEGDFYYLEPIRRVWRKKHGCVQNQ